MGVSPPERAALTIVLERARSLGFLGPGPVDAHIDHAHGFAIALGGWWKGHPAEAVDLGPGGGIPGIVLARVWPGSRWRFVEASRRRASFLRKAVVELGIAARVQVMEGRAEDVARSPGQRGTADLVVARSFGPPAVAAECAAPFLRHGGWLVVSEPPDGGERWPRTPLQRLGLGLVAVEEVPARFAVLRQLALAPDTFPRPTRHLVKRPLF